jgi:hypothetical protein
VHTPVILLRCSVHLLTIIKQLAGNIQRHLRIAYSDISELVGTLMDKAKPTVADSRTSLITDGMNGSNCLAMSSNANMARNIPAIEPDEVFFAPRPTRKAGAAEDSSSSEEELQTEELWQEIFKRNEDAKRPVVDLPKKQHLVLELTNDEKTGGTRSPRDVAHDSSLLCLVLPAPQNPAQATEQPSSWCGFSGPPRNSEIVSSHGEEKAGAENDLAFPSGEWVPVTSEWLDREQLILTEEEVEGIEEWLAERVTEALETPYRVDTSDPEWLSGVLLASGTRKQWQSYSKSV